MTPYSQSFSQQINSLARLVAENGKHVSTNRGSKFQTEQAELRRREIIGVLKATGGSTAADIATWCKFSIRMVRDSLDVMAKDGRISMISSYPRKYKAT